MKRRKYQPYVRRANGQEMSESFRIAFRLAFYQEIGKPFFVMIQHGFPNLAIDVGRTKRELQQSPLGVATGRYSFREWSRIIKRQATGRES